jgi:hypothetical protein
MLNQFSGVPGASELRALKDMFPDIEKNRVDGAHKKKGQRDRKSRPFGQTQIGPPDRYGQSCNQTDESENGEDDLNELERTLTLAADTVHQGISSTRYN